MRVAICVSGIPRSGVGNHENRNQDVVRNHLSLKKNFPEADFYFGTWERHKDIVNKHFSDHKKYFFSEPITDYHSWFDLNPDVIVSKKMREFLDKYRQKKDLHERIKDQNRQILCHANLVSCIEKDYDIIIRARYDTYTYSHGNWLPYLEWVHENQAAIGFANTKPWENFNKTVDLDSKDGNRDCYLFDSLIMHSAKNINISEIIKLYEKKSLCPAEFGWYQVLSKPYGSNHRCVNGWANADRCVLQNFLNGEK